MSNRLPEILVVLKEMQYKCAEELRDNYDPITGLTNVDHKTIAIMTIIDYIHLKEDRAAAEEPKNAHTPL